MTKAPKPTVSYATMLRRVTSLKAEHHIGFLAFFFTADFVFRTNKAVRQVFHGSVTYSSMAYVETVDGTL